MFSTHLCSSQPVKSHLSTIQLGIVLLHYCLVGSNKHSYFTRSSTELACFYIGISRLCTHIMLKSFVSNLNSTISAFFFFFHNVKELFVSFNITKLQHFFLFCKFLMLKIVSLKRFELLRYLSSLQPLLQCVYQFHHKELHLIIPKIMFKLWARCLYIILWKSTEDF